MNEKIEKGLKESLCLRSRISPSALRAIATLRFPLRVEEVKQWVNVRVQRDKQRLSWEGEVWNKIQRMQASSNGEIGLAVMQALDWVRDDKEMATPFKIGCRCGFIFEGRRNDEQRRRSSRKNHGSDEGSG